MKKSRSSLLTRLNQLAASNNAYLSETVLLKNCALGTTAYNEKLFIIKKLEDKSYDIIITSFSGIKKCSIRKTHINIPGNKNKHGSTETHLQKISLWLEYDSIQQPLELIFYEYRYNSLYEMPELSQKASYWEQLINNEINLQDVLQYKLKTAL
ncbi:MAG: hypothetical protein ABIQ88_03605 [Chitinophagaceae bacterium]